MVFCCGSPSSLIQTNLKLMIQIAVKRAIFLVGIRHLWVFLVIRFLFFGIWNKQIFKVKLTFYHSLFPFYIVWLANLSNLMQINSYMDPLCFGKSVFHYHSKWRAVSLFFTLCALLNIPCVCVCKYICEQFFHELVLSFMNNL